MKIAGRDAGKLCVVVEAIDENFVLIDGETRRRKCNVRHLEPLEQVVSLGKGADHGAVVSAFKELGVTIVDKKSKKAAPRPVSRRTQKSAAKPEKPVKKAKKAAKKAVKKAGKKE